MSSAGRCGTFAVFKARTLWNYILFVKDLDPLNKRIDSNGVVQPWVSAIPVARQMMIEYHPRRNPHHVLLILYLNRVWASAVT